MARCAAGVLDTYVFPGYVIWDADLFAGQTIVRDLGPLSTLTSVALLMPFVTVGTRRLQDIDCNGCGCFCT